MNIESYMVDTVTIKSVTSRDGAGDPVFGSARTIKARVEDGGLIFRDSDGNEIQPEHTFTTQSEVKLTDRVWLPGDDTTDANASKRPLIVRRARRRDGSGGHYEVSL